MSETKLVTIAIALYNNVNYVHKCVESVLSQTYKKLEVVIIDDGSTDASLDVCQKYDYDNRIRIITQENSGLSVVRQRALEEAKGQFMMFIDADDFLEMDCVENLLTIIEKNSADICVCSTRFIDEAGTFLSGYSKQFECKINQEITNTKDRLSTEYCKFIEQFMMSDSWNKMYRCSFLKKSGVRFCLTKGRNGSDTAFNHKILIHSPIITGTSYIGYNHVMYKKSAVHRKCKKLQDSFFEIEKQLAREASKCKMNDLSQQLSEVYIGMMLTAFQDVYNEEVSMCHNPQKGMKELVNTHKIFIEENGIKIQPLSYSRNTITVFALLLKYLPVLLPVFLQIRYTKLKRKCP